MRKQKITRPELEPWPRAKATIGNAGAEIVDGESKTTPAQIAAICAAMDNVPSAELPMRSSNEGRKGDYILPNLPPNGMRFQQTKKVRRNLRTLRG